MLTTPDLPTVLNNSASKLPNSSSLLADIEATLANSLLPSSISFDCDLNDSTTSVRALSMSLLMSIGLDPAAIFCTANLIIS